MKHVITGLVGSDHGRGEVEFEVESQRVADERWLDFYSEKANVQIKLKSSELKMLLKFFETEERQCKSL